MSLSKYPLDVQIMGPDGQELPPFSSQNPAFDSHGRLIPSPALAAMIEQQVTARLAAVAQELRASAQATRLSNCGFPQLAAVATALDAVAAALDPGGELQEDVFTKALGGFTPRTEPTTIAPLDATPSSRCCGAPTFRDGDRLICDKCRTSKPV